MNASQAVALGERDADLVVTGSDVVLPELGERRERSVAVVEDRVAALVEDPERVTGPDTTVVDASGSVVVPGFVDAHTHLDAQQAFERSYHHSLAGGTTAIVSEVTGMGPAFGADGTREFLEATADLPVEVFAALCPTPLLDTFDPAWADEAELDALVDLLERERVVGVGETDWIHVVGRDAPVEALYEAARDRGAVITGHGAGCRDEKLQAFASVVDNDHEPVTPEGVLDRLANGIHVVGRAGTIRDDLGALAAAYREVGAADLSLSTDGRWPRELAETGHMNWVVRRAIEEGIDPVDAVRMATLNPARHFGLGDRGSLTPGNRADVVVCSDLESVAVETVVAGGEVVVSDGEPTVEPRPHDYPDRFRDTVSLDGIEEWVRVSESAAPGGRVRAMEYTEGLLSTETTAEVPVVDGTLRPAPEDGLLKATVVERRPGSEGRSFTGFVRGLGIERGAVASSLAWEQPAVIGVGASDAALVTALEHVDDLGGGLAVVDEGKVVADHPLDIAGSFADLPVEETMANLDAVQGALRDLGASAANPVLSVATLTFFGVPTLKLTFDGYADILGRRVVGLAPEEE
jgi:adenine deaminase